MTYNQFDDADDELDDLRLEEAHKRRLAAHQWRHPHPQDPDYIGPEDEDE